MDKIDKLKEIAQQLSHPSGTKGSEMAAMMHATNSQMTAHAIALLRLKSSNQLLEIGHGNAAHVPPILQEYTDMHYTGLEISELMHKEAKEINHSMLAKQKADFILYDGMLLPFAKASFDKVFTVNTIYFWTNPLQMLQEISRVLRDQGLLALTFALKSFMQTLPFTAYGFQLYDLNEVEILAKTAGLTLETADRQFEPVRNKTGELVQREYVTILFRKTIGIGCHL